MTREEALRQEKIISNNAGMFYMGVFDDMGDKNINQLINEIYDDFEENKFEKPFISKGKDIQKNINMYIDEDKTYEVCLRVIEKDNIVKDK
jgi:hypothetical protein